ncbi:chaperonin 10-like protein [Chytridium lagenaria]|nr:chaperonin 10-like protein [Chytridium lagenaria]
MKGYTHTSYDLPTPRLKSKDDILIRIKAIGLNAADWHMMRGDPYLVRMLTGLTGPRKGAVIGGALAGVVQEVGEGVTMFKVGDEVYAESAVTVLGAFSEFVCVAEKLVSLKPTNLSFEEAAGIPVSGPTALQAVRDGAKVKPGDKVLIHGVMYDAVVDIVTTKRVSDVMGVVKMGGVYVGCGGVGRDVFMGTAWDHLVASMSPFKEPECWGFGVLKGLCEEGKFVVHVDRRYKFEELVSAMEYLEEGHVRGKLVITV